MDIFDYLEAFFDKYGEVTDVTQAKGKSGLSTGDVIIHEILTRKIFNDIRDILTYGGRKIFVVVQCQRFTVGLVGLRDICLMSW